ncbi:MAG: hypothetical protein IPG59_04515 [Candidatus Melainabacteria bacterium]|nr:MAG: hypothetical protein IPG59_04515 [Candidatus Melainabacteria bacterium]
MSKLQSIIAFSLMASGLIVSLDAAYKAETGFSSIPLVFVGPRFFIVELLAPRVAYGKFQDLIANKETAKITIESVDLVDTNYAGKYLSVKFRNDSKYYRVRRPQICNEDSIKRLESYGISVGFYWSCL